MTTIDIRSAQLDPALGDAAVVAAVAGVAVDQLAPLATRIDHEGHYPLEVMASLARAGAFAGHLRRNGGRYGLALGAMHEISRQCGSTGFLTWAHDVCALYLEQSGNPALDGQLLDDHVAGRSFGGTGLSNPMKAFAGIERMLLRARRVAGGYRVSGALPWVSHIGPGQYFGAIASVYRDDQSHSHDIIFLVRCDQQVVLRQCPEFSGMEGTSTWGVRLEDYFVGEDNMIADPARPFIEKIRAAFILLQIGMATGLIQGALDSMRDVEPLLGHVNQFLDDRPDELEAEYLELAGRVARLVGSPFDGSKDYMLDVLDARAQGAELALRATQSALLHQGARGYLINSAPQRRVREAHFAAIVTPAIKHLRSEMARLSREEVPA
ncbi:acyl-CoA dehydrogenase [Herbaspirillum sp. BH-1]|uniref:Alkylation response protein AidB-like acyl-CoA dehydrogenase n=1 Tax=Herbaspirillum frisingense TaxID=92645 RepID=A0ABU1PH01_9BURK|nr:MULTISPECIES: acyl-CoA dehydrogenase family protein [Herbaspirillum]MDR6585181.1 alkylation response protein AidB-like acyl-CoA dehydrogenase [Herbaspirillum frisingense]PLY57219.1 acyl-CoA dehydrogenase [Herbaspirillum sp. BH-1]